MIERKTAVAAKNPGKCKVKHCACKGYYVDTVTGKNGRLPKSKR